MRRASLSLTLAVLLPVLASAAPQEARTDEEQAIRDLNQAVEAHIQRAGTPGQPVVAASIHASRHISDKALAALHHFGQLRRLNLADTQIGDDGLAHLQG